MARANKSKIKKWYKKQNTIKLSSNKTTQFNYSPTFPLFDDFMQYGLFHVNTLPKWFKLFFVKEMKNTFQNYQNNAKSLDHQFCCNKKSNSISILSSVAIIYYWARKNTFAIPETPAFNPAIIRHRNAMPEPSFVVKLLPQFYSVFAKLRQTQTGTRTVTKRWNTTGAIGCKFDLITAVCVLAGQVMA